VARYEDSWFVGAIDIEPGAGLFPVPRSNGETHRFDLGEVEVSLVTGGSTQLATDHETNTAILLHGDLYDAPNSNQARYAVDQYLRYGEAACLDLNGSFALVVMDGSSQKVQVVTDRLNSRKVFLEKRGQAFWLSTSLYRHPLKDATLDPAGIGSVLTSGVAHNGLTPFNGIQVLQRASIHTFDRNGKRSKEYWSYQFNNDNAQTPREDLRQEMAEVLRDAVRRRLNAAKGTIFLSMSGGHDSKSIAGFLRQMVDDPARLAAITYHCGPRVGDTDARAAERGADLLNIDHVVLPAYHGDMLSLTAVNGLHGQGMAHFCEEADMWEGLASLFSIDSSSVLFVGDMFWNRPPRWAEPTPAGVLALIDVFPPSVIGSFVDRLGSGGQAIQEGWHASFSDLVRKVDQDLDPRDAQEVMYLDQRVTNTLMLWRECFQMPRIQVMNPYLDNQVLDFVSTLPVELRDGKTLYKEALNGAFPELFQLPPAKGGWNAPDWSQELLKSRSNITHWIETHPSMLDDLLPPKVILSLFGLGSMSSKTDSAIRIGRSVVKRSAILRHTVRRLKAARVDAVPNHVHWSRLLRRILNLRMFLNQVSS